MIVTHSRAISATVAALCLTLPAWGQSVAVTKTNSTKVYMHYMPWFQTPNSLGGTGGSGWGYHWKMNTQNPNIVDASGKRQIASHYYPMIGTYDSTDPMVLVDVRQPEEFTAPPGHLPGAINVPLGELSERTEELAHANEALRDADRRKDEFLAMLAHELRNPLTPITNALEILRLANDTGDTVRRQRERMERQVAQLKRLVEDLLDVARHFVE